jgi:signal transduction histidine kinase
VILTGQIENSMDYLLSLIENILDMAELRKNGVALKKRQFDMKQMVKSCNAHISSLCRQKAISCMWVSSVDGQYIGDKKRLSQCVVNFLENAVKFNKKGGRIRVDIGKWTSTESESEDKFIIQIYDNGIGMSPEQMESMYLPFVKNKIHEGDMEASPGIGLTVSKMILDAMNGKIEVCSELQYGTTIILYFSLPRVEKLPKSVDNLEDKMYTQV